jgi:hypothetical protein
MKSTIRGFRSLALGLCVAAGALAAPAAFARSHVSVGVSVPGVSVGYNSGWHGHNNYYVGVGGGYYGPRYRGYYGGYYGGYYPGYYAPAPVYYGRPYGSCYTRSFYDARGYYHPGYYYSC